MTVRVIKARTATEIDAVRHLVWEFFDFLRDRYPEMLAEIDGYIQDQGVAHELDNFDRFFLPPHGECFLGLHEHAPVGIVMLKPRGTQDGEMNRMYVRDSARGLGLGRKLAGALVEEARSIGYQTLWLDALYRHTEAIPLYESLGFRRYDDPNAFGGDDKRIVHMKMRLSGYEKR